MDKGKQIGNSITAFLLVLVFLFPVVVQASHSFEKDAHEVCHEKKVHLHEAEPDCPICHYQLSTFQYNPFESLDLLSAAIFATVEQHFSSTRLRSYQNTSIQLRAPPLAVR